MKQHKLFDLACVMSLICVLVMMIACVAMLFAELIVKPDPSFAGFTWIQPYALTLVALFAACISVLWVEGWWYVLQGWNDRLLGLNLALLAFLLVGPVFAAYVFHFSNTRRRRCQRESQHLPS